MRKALFAIAVLLVLLFSTEAAFAVVHVRGYFRKDGTYVQPHYRSDPDGNPYNNWSFPGNTNPYTGKVAPGNPDTYLKNYSGCSYGSGSSSLDFSSPSLPSHDRSKTLYGTEESNYFLSALPHQSADGFAQNLPLLKETYPIKDGIGSITWMVTIPSRWPTAAIFDLQNYLNERGYRDYRGRKLVVDGEYGVGTFSAHMAYFYETRGFTGLLQARAEEPAAWPRPAGKYFTLGSSRQEVEKIQGTPTSIIGDTWDYGFSSVYFEDGKVSGYSNISDNLRVKLLPKTRVSPKHAHSYFAIGSSKDEVLAIQGTPSSITGETWDYKFSSVYFNGDRVNGYSNISRNLRVRAE